ncbi:MAG: hypothetical protein C0513_02320 [Isosphaera sp.]|nr:hypothetical protein [Isosphaera sp.]
MSLCSIAGPLSDGVPVSHPLDRRSVLLGGGFALAGMALSACQSAAPLAGRSLPGPLWGTPTPTPGQSSDGPKLPPVAGSTVSVPAGTPKPTATLAVLPRTAWTRSRVARPENTKPLARVSRITVHHDGVNAFTSADQAAAAARIETIRQSHLQRKARDGSRWADIGYHFVIDPAGRVWEARSTTLQGAHVQDHNEENLGVLCLGHFDQQRPSDRALWALEQFLALQMTRHRVPLSRVHTHRELNSTICPGRNLQRSMDVARRSGGGLLLALDSMGGMALAFA